MKNFPSEITKTKLSALKLLNLEVDICGDHWHMTHNGRTIASRFRGHIEWAFEPKYSDKAKQVEKILGVKCVSD